jgi:hypothetical protein
MNEEPDETNRFGSDPLSIRFYHLCDRCIFSASGINNCPLLLLTMLDESSVATTTTCTKSDGELVEQREKINTLDK